MTFRLGSRGSALARWQAEHVLGLLRAQHPDLEVEVRILRTTGDRIRDVPLARIGDKGLFTKEIDRAVLSGAVDAAVHSLKDMPTNLGDGLALGAVLAREDPRDAFLPAPGRGPALDDLPEGACIGTSSLRRRALLLNRRPDLRVESLRGNLDTRLSKLDDGAYDGAILAMAGIRRLEREDIVGEALEPPAWLPAAGQGALAVVVRADDEETRRLLDPLDDPRARVTTTAERTFLRLLEGGCQIPIGALAREADGGRLRLHGFVASLDGRTLLREEAQGDVGAAESVGESAARALLERGASALLRRVREQAAGHLPQASAP